MLSQSTQSFGIYSFKGKEDPKVKYVRAGLTPCDQVLCVLLNSNCYSCSCRRGSEASADKINLTKTNEHNPAYTLLSENSQYSGKYFHIDSEK